MNKSSWTFRKNIQNTDELSSVIYDSNRKALNGNLEEANACVQFFVKISNEERNLGLKLFHLKIDREIKKFFNNKIDKNQIRFVNFSKLTRIIKILKITNLQDMTKLVQ